MEETTDFGAPVKFGVHHFYVEIPPGSRAAVRIYEDYGFDGDESVRETYVCRVNLARELWTRIRDDARRDFNTRLKAKKRKTGSWTVGKVLLDRFLGRELCVLAWAAELASPDQCAIICQKWLALRPEERWWLFSKTASEAGLEDQANRGWRKALYCALSDGTNVRVAPKKSPAVIKKKSRNECELSLFENIESGDI